MAGGKNEKLSEGLCAGCCAALVMRVRKINTGRSSYRVRTNTQPRTGGTNVHQSSAAHSPKTLFRSAGFIQRHRSIAALSKFIIVKEPFISLLWSEQKDHFI